MTKYKALIIGAGSIGALKPDEFDSPESKQIYTHAHACYSHPNIELVGICEKDYHKSWDAARKWNTSPWESIKQFDDCGGREPDIVIVAVNTENHYNTIHQLIPYKPKVIICEKPFCMNYEQAKNISELCQQAGIGLIINYQRSFVPELKQLSDDLKSGVYGDVYNFTLRYSRGLKRDGCHAIYWCLKTFGNVGISQECDNKYAFDNVEKGDANPHYFFESELCPIVSFIPIGSAYSTYNADIYTEKGRIELLNNWKTVRFHENTKSTYGPYPATGLMFVDKTTQLDQALTFLLDYTIKNIDNIPVDPYALEVHKHLKLSV